MKSKKINAKDRCINAKLLKDNTYPLIDSVKYSDGSLYEVHLDDYGQSYFVVYLDNEGNTQEIGCGTYNLDYIDTINYVHDTLGRKGKRL